MLETRTVLGSCRRPLCRSCMGYCRSTPWVSAASFLSWVGHSGFLPSCGWAAGEADARGASSFSGFCSPHTHTEPIGKRGGEEGRRQTNPWGHFGNVVTSHKQVPPGADCYFKAWLWRKFCLKTLTWWLVFHSRKGSVQFSELVLKAGILPF